MNKRSKREGWTPVLNEQGEQVGWNTGADEIRFSTHEVFLQRDGFFSMAAKMKERKQRTRAKVAKRERGQGESA